MWTSLISNKKQWESIFGVNYTPKKLKISYAIFKDNSITLTLYNAIEGNEAPDKWLKNGYNEYEFELLLNNVTNVNITNFSFYGALDLTIIKNSTDNDIQIEINNFCKIECKAQSISAINIKAYHNDGSV
ncbi:Imm50 family immunity protein [Pseudomonas sp. OV226]|jgi:hypothetical protein|uniref:Imm50 family immunity protein n=1 Tax=Pseudomonas sp. OV226 TaxID=2135588 RepID=UPI000D7A8E11|nr:Imm50 family immunity protein [Pseudomonas sp. OV226]PWK26982.1 immunity protein 50 of polymorphic toxin system [Pseudomonas sp. OV226]